MEEIDVVGLKDRAPNVKLVQIGHGHDDHFCIEEGQNKRKEGAEVEGYDVVGVVGQDGVVVVGSDVAQAYTAVKERI